MFVAKSVVQRENPSSFAISEVLKKRGLALHLGVATARPWSLEPIVKGHSLSDTFWMGSGSKTADVTFKKDRFFHEF